MSDDIVGSQRVPGVSDRGARRFRIFSFDFDSRAMDLQDAPREEWSEETREQWQRRREQLVAGLAAEYGSWDIDRKIEDFAAFGTKPFSIVTHHNVMFDHVRTAFASGAYYAALTGACAPGDGPLLADNQRDRVISEGAKSLSFRISRLPVAQRRYDPSAMSASR